MSTTHENFVWNWLDPVHDVSLGSILLTSTSTLPAADTEHSKDWEASYAEYLAETTSSSSSSAAVAATMATTAMGLQSASKDATWEEQYAAYCAEKEAALNELDRKSEQHENSS